MQFPSQGSLTLAAHYYAPLRGTTNPSHHDSQAS